MDTFFGSYFHFCLETALETSAKASLIPSLKVHYPNHTQSLANFQWSGLSDQRALQLTESRLPIQKWCPYKARGVVPEPICANKVRNGPATADQGSSLASQSKCHVHGTSRWTHPHPPIPPFLLVQNLCSKRIAPTDNVTKVRWCHIGLSVVKGLRRRQNSSPLMIIMTTLVTDTVRFCQVRVYHIDLAVTSICMAVNEIHDRQTTQNPKLKLVKDSHSPMITFMMCLTRVTFTEGLDKGLPLNLSLAGQLLLNFSLQIYFDTSTYT